MFKLSDLPEEGVKYCQGMTIVWSDGEKIIVRNKTGNKWVKDNVEQIFGTGEWDNILSVSYAESYHPINRVSNVQGYQCISGYIPQRVIEDLKEELPDIEKRKAALEALRDR